MSRHFRSDLFWVPDADGADGSVCCFFSAFQSPGGDVRLSRWVVAGDKDDLLRTGLYGESLPIDKAYDFLCAFEEKYAAHREQDIDRHEKRLGLCTYHTTPHYSENPACAALAGRRAAAARVTAEEQQRLRADALRRGHRLHIRRGR